MAEQTTQPGGGKEAVGTGTNTLEATGNAKLDARKLIMARADSGRDAEVSIDEEDHPSAAAIAAAIAEAAGEELSEEDARAITEETLMAHQNEIEASAGITAGEEIVEEEEPVVAPVVAAPAEVTPPGEESVALQVFGQTLYLPKSEVEARGGVAATQMMLAADHRFRQATQLTEDAARLHTAAASKLDEATKLERELLAKSSAAGTAPGQQPVQPTKPGQLDDETRAAVKRLTGEMWKGDPEATEKALTEVLAVIATRGPNAKGPSVEEIAQLVQTKVEAALLKARADDRTAQVKTANKREADEVNHLMANKYAAVDTDPELRSMAQGLFRAARSDPRNKGRSLVSIADDVGARVLEMVGAPGQTGTATPAATRQELRTRTTLKRRLPQPSSVSERSPTAADQQDYPTKGSEIVRMMRAARNQPVN